MAACTTSGKHSLRILYNDIKSFPLFGCLHNEKRQSQQAFFYNASTGLRESASFFRRRFPCRARCRLASVVGGGEQVLFMFGEVVSKLKINIRRAIATFAISRFQ
jgi:hypothetical protein